MLRKHCCKTLTERLHFWICLGRFVSACYKFCTVRSEASPVAARSIQGNKQTMLKQEWGISKHSSSTLTSSCITSPAPTIPPTLLPPAPHKRQTRRLLPPPPRPAQQPIRHTNKPIRLLPMPPLLCMLNRVADHPALL